MSVKENEAFERIWQEWLRSRDLRAQVTRHIAERKAFLEFVETYVRQGATPHTNGCATRVLEVGCGSAIDSMYLAERLAVEFYACDLSENAIRVARRLSRHFARPVRFLAADIRKLSFAAETFDVVFSQGVLEHFRDPSAVMSEHARVTKKGGFVIVDVPQTYNPYTLYKKFQMRKGVWPFGWETQHSISDLRRMVRPYGLMCVGVGSWGDTFGFSFSARSRHLRFLDSLAANYFRLMNRLFPSLGHYYRQNLTGCFVRVDSSRRGGGGS